MIGAAMKDVAPAAVGVAPIMARSPGFHVHV
jgi:hypothetical protein